jgi:hypothetical protein
MDLCPAHFTTCTDIRLQLQTIYEYLTTSSTANLRNLHSNGYDLSSASVTGTNFAWQHNPENEFSSEAALEVSQHTFYSDISTGNTKEGKKGKA